MSSRPASPSKAVFGTPTWRYAPPAPSRTRHREEHHRRPTVLTHANLPPSRAWHRTLNSTGLPSFTADRADPTRGSTDATTTVSHNTKCLCAVREFDHSALPCSPLARHYRVKTRVRPPLVLTRALPAAGCCSSSSSSFGARDLIVFDCVQSVQAGLVFVAWFLLTGLSRPAHT